MNKRVCALVLTGCLIGALPLVYAADDQASSSSDKPAAHHKWEGKKGKWAKDLNLTDDQKKQLEANTKSDREQMKSIMNQMRDKNKALREELEKDSVDQAKVTQIQTDLKNLQGQMVDARVNKMMQLKKILTPEQFKKFNADMDQHMEHMGEHHHKGMKGHMHHDDDNDADDQK